LAYNRYISSINPICNWSILIRVLKGILHKMNV